MKQLLKYFIAINGLWLLLVTAGPAQDNLPLLITSGTTIESAGTNWNYLVWQANQPQLLMDKMMAVFRKTGGVAANTTFELVGTVGVETDPYAIETLIQKSTALGEDEALLDQTISELFEDFIPSGSLALSTKMSAVIQGALADSVLFDNLTFLGKRHPAINMALGLGFADDVSAGTYTYEVRDFDSVSNAYGRVIGRVTLTTGSPVELPAPENLIEVEDTSPKGDRNVRLRWSSPDDLLRLSMLQFGFNVYRIRSKFAIKDHFDSVPPTPQQLTNSLFTQVNTVPVMPDEDNDERKWFFVDDNHRFDEGQTALTNGESFYYFVTARDILGRNGLVSDGLAVTVCDRVPPFVPRDVKTRSDSDYTSGNTQIKFDLSWKPNVSTNGDITAGYYVYRGTNFVEIQRDATNPALHLISGLIPHSTNASRIHFADTNFTSASLGQTYWYGVRAIDDGACGANYSGLSAPAFAAVHDFSAAPAPTDTSIAYIEEDLMVQYEDDRELSSEDESSYYEVSCTRDNDQIAWAEFYWKDTDTGDVSRPIGGRRYFPEGANSVSAYLVRDKNLTFYCRAGTRSGKLSTIANINNVIKPQKSHYRLVVFKAELSYDEVTTESFPGPWIHVTPEDALGIPGYHWPQLRFSIPPGVAEWRLYRSVDGHRPYDMIVQGLNTNNLTEVIEEDKGAGIVYGATLCYYLQFLDENGNPGPIELIECIEVQGRELPKPMLMDLSPAGSVDAPQMKVEWFCPPVAVEYFLVGVHVDDDDVMSTIELDGCQRVDYTNDYPIVMDDGTTNFMDFAFFKTGRVGTQFGSGTNPLFDVSASIQLGHSYSAFVRGVGVGNKQSPDSDGMTFQWSQPEGIGPQVPWPVRPPVFIQNETYSTNLYPVYLTPELVPSMSYDHIGINIGQLNNYVYGKPPTYKGNGNIDIMSKIYTNEATGSSTMFPFVLYRYQVTNALYEQVSGDVYQVTPLMESIAYSYDSEHDETSIFDPYVYFARFPGQEIQRNIMLIDHQPVQRGAAYRYVMVRFDEHHEIERIIPAGTITVPEE
ncbi:MAG: hypothetical protein EOL87_13125 [Spartobacteria bacterium]|nr:hypothetical protein [Spartobacteria bacterium]